jgi:CubicO group peptidase (beta-lactamase class C family)
VLTILVVACTPPDRAAIEARRPDLTVGVPVEVGLSAEALARIGPAMQQLVDEGATAGVMTLVARRGVVVHWEAHGSRVLGGEPLEPNDIFRIYSMTKPITSTAVMILVEDGVLGLDDPLAAYLPAFDGIQVYDDGALRAPSRAITIRDLLRHTSGLTYGIFGDSPVDRMYRAELGAILDPQSGLNLAQFVDRVAEFPLLTDPGNRWNYSLSTDVLGRVVEVTSGMSLQAFFQSRIFEPLGMHETDFHVALERLERFTAVYRSGEDGLRMIDSPTNGLFTREPTWYSGGGGLTSTAMDYLRFAQMMLNEGELDGVRILRPETVREMTRDQLLDVMSQAGPAATDGFGLGFAVSVRGETPGLYWWAGVMNTWFWVDPVEEIVAFTWTQYDPFGAVPINPMMRRLVYDALVDSNRMAPAGTP